MSRYHKDVYFPKKYLRVFGDVKLTYPNYSVHAQDKAVANKNCTIVLPAVLNLKQEYLFEIEVENGQAVKGCYRIPYDDTYDLCVVRYLKGNVISTVWLNHKEDKHCTLQADRYRTTNTSSRRKAEGVTSSS